MSESCFQVQRVDRKRFFEISLCAAGKTPWELALLWVWELILNSNLSVVRPGRTTEFMSVLWSISSDQQDTEGEEPPVSTTGIQPL